MPVSPASPFDQQAFVALCRLRQPFTRAMAAQVIKMDTQEADLLLNRLRLHGMVYHSDQGWCVMMPAKVDRPLPLAMPEMAQMRTTDIWRIRLLQFLLDQREAITADVAQHIAEPNIITTKRLGNLRARGWAANRHSDENKKSTIWSITDAGRIELSRLLQRTGVPV